MFPFSAEASVLFDFAYYQGLVADVKFQFPAEASGLFDDEFGCGLITMSVFQFPAGLSRLRDGQLITSSTLDSLRFKL